MVRSHLRRNAAPIMPGLSRVLEVNMFGEVGNTYEILTLSLEGPPDGWNCSKNTEGMGHT